MQMGLETNHDEHQGIVKNGSRRWFQNANNLSYMEGPRDGNSWRKDRYSEMKKCKIHIFEGWEGAYVNGYRSGHG